MSKLTLQREATRLPLDGESYLEEYKELDYAFDDTGAALTLLVPATAAAPILLTEVIHVVTTAFANAGANTINVGDGSDADAYVDEADVTETSAGDVARSIMKANAKSAGEYLTAARQITVTLSANMTAGAGKVIAKFIRL